jgi:hypothetical protein
MQKNCLASNFDSTQLNALCVEHCESLGGFTPNVPSMQTTTTKNLNVQYRFCNYSCFEMQTVPVAQKILLLAQKNELFIMKLTRVIDLENLVTTLWSFFVVLLCHSF